MAFTFTLSAEDADFLRDQLEQRIAHLDLELIHTDRRELQRALAHDVDRLRAIAERLATQASFPPAGTFLDPSTGAEKP